VEQPSVSKPKAARPARAAKAAEPSPPAAKKAGRTEWVGLKAFLEDDYGSDDEAEDAKTKARADDAVESAEQRIVEDDDGVIPEGKLE
jgi:segregation and condensation protein B